MRKYTKILSSLLALIMALTMCEGLFTLSASADEETTETTTETTTDTTTEEGGDGEEPEEPELPDYTRIKYATAQEKLDSIIAGLEYDLEGNHNPEGKNIYTKFGDYYLYADAFSGEVIWQNAKTGELLLTNPYDVAYSDTATSQKTRYDLLSQVLLTYDDAGAEKTMNSYIDACQREQISVKYITNGIRVDYAMGEEEARKLVPRMIEKSRFETLILDKVTDEKDRLTMETYFLLYDLDSETATDAQKSEWEKLYPITKSMAIYGFDSAAGKRELSKVEAIIKKYTQYTYDDMNEDHAMTGYQGNDAAPAVFKFGLEYTLCEDGALTVRLAANGLRYDEDNYQLKEISILPYFGATNNYYEGYTFLPDGSGALIENSMTPYTLSGKVYGIDNAYHQIIGANQQVMRLPVFGVTQYTDLIEEEEESDVEQTKDDRTEEEIRQEQEELMEELGITDSEYAEELEEEAEGEETTEEGEEAEGEEEEAPEEELTKPANNAGYVAIIEEGASLATITSTHGGSVYKYSSVYTKFIPRASDTYDLKNTLSVGGTSYTVTSKRKYTGSYTLRFYMLTDDAMATGAGYGEDDYYEVSYVGMAKAYQDYLVAGGTLTALTDDTTEKDVPLYIESLGALDTDDTFLSMPVTVKTPLTTFDDLESMYNSLTEKGIGNVNFRLSGFANGGMVSTYPYKVKFEKVVGGNSGFEDFLALASEKGFGVFPDFDFSYVRKTAAFDGFSLKNQAVRTIDDRYTTKREYDPAQQKFKGTRYVAVSAASIPELYEGFYENFSKYGAAGISVGTLGDDLNSDFDRDDPYDRNDAEGYVESTLGKISEDYQSVMIDGGNSYALKYADHILNISLDSSRYASASKSIPFLSMVLHGYVQYAGAPTNMASDSGYETLKMIENGSNPYYMLSYQNLSELKEAGMEFSKFYSVDFTIWLEDLVDTYNTVNGALGGLQTETIVDHDFLDGERVHTAEEAAQGGNFSTDSGTIVRVEYSDGTVFYINYNDYAVTASDGKEIPASTFVKA